HCHTAELDGRVLLRSSSTHIALKQPSGLLAPGSRARTDRGTSDKGGRDGFGSVGRGDWRNPQLVDGRNQIFTGSTCNGRIRQSGLQRSGGAGTSGHFAVLRAWS